MMIVERAEVRGEEIGPLDGQVPSRDGRPEAKKLGGLVLARQLGESVMIGDEVMIEVFGLKANTVRLRITAPRSVAVHRREVYDAIRLAPRPMPPAPAVPATPTADGGPGGLVLTRRTGQTIMIGDQVAVDVVDARPGTVRLRVIAPRSIAVHRREVYDAIQAGGLGTKPGEFAAED